MVNLFDDVSGRSYRVWSNRMINEAIGAVKIRVSKRSAVEYRVKYREDEAIGAVEFEIDIESS